MSLLVDYPNSAKRGETVQPPKARARRREQGELARLVINTKAYSAVDLVA